MSLVENAVNGLAYFLYSGLQQKLEPIRLARTGYALLASGCSVKGDFPRYNLASDLIETQREDGGWADVEETLWCLGYLSFFGERHEAQLGKGKKWLTAVRLPCGAWEKSERDQPRISLTALASVLVPDIADSSAE